MADCFFFPFQFQVIIRSKQSFGVINIVLNIEWKVQANGNNGRSGY